MTAEIAILNQTAVALAADSKVTIGRGEYGKTYDTVNKLFTLSKYEPVGVMVYGNAEFMGFPWETIIKIHRENLGLTSLDKITEYSENFFEKLLEEYAFTSTDEDWNVKKIFVQYFDWLQWVVRESIEINGRKEPDLGRRLSRLLKRETQRLSALPNVLQGTTAEKLRRRYASQVREAQEAVFAGGLTSRIQNQLSRVSGLLLLKEEFSPGSSGVVIAGFGKRERFPTLIAQEVDGVIAGQIKKAQRHFIDIRRGMRAAIIPFAQQEMVHRFMQGIDPEYEQYLQGAVLTLCQNVCDSVIDRYVKGRKPEKQTIKEEVGAALTTMLEQFFKEGSEYRRGRFTNPVLDMLVMLPKDEMANMAESLVNLTSLKRRVSAEAESVGGPLMSR